MVDIENQYFIKDGHRFAVRFFDCDNSHDLKDLVTIVESPPVQRWMENVTDLSFSNYRSWMDEKGERMSFLFAIADERVRGFVYIYPSKILENCLEISYAKGFDAPSGLIVPAIEIVCKYVFEYLCEKKPWFVTPELKILAEIEKENVPSIKVIEKSGFVKIRDFDEESNGLWARDLSVPDVEEPKEDVLVSDIKLGRVRQLNGSYCGPSVLQILLSHFGIQADQESIVEAGASRKHVIENGMSVELLAKAVNTLYPEMSLWVKRDGTLDDLERMVRQYNYPVGIDWQGIFESSDYETGITNVEETVAIEDSACRGDDGHYCVVVDVDRGSNKIRMMDPYGHYAEHDRYFEMDEFLNRWWDDRTDNLPDGSKKYIFERRLMFVVVPKSVRIPEVLGMVEI